MLCIASLTEHNSSFDLLFLLIFVTHIQACDLANYVCLPRNASSFSASIKADDALDF